MRKLIEGIVQFRETQLAQYAAHFRDLAEGQQPDALFITCSDSRVVPNLLASTEPGDLFTMRNVGNLVPPATAEGVSTGDVSEASAIEYAVLVLEVPSIVICGHSQCGAMQTLLTGKRLAQAPNLDRWLHHAAAAAARLKREGGLNGTLAPDDQLSQLNVLVQLEHLMTYSIVRERVIAGSLHLAGWWFDIASGAMWSYEPDRRSFAPIERALGAELMERFGERSA
ncbi:MAG: carbonic anhydrase [Burkholderiales bacterium]